MRIILDPGHGGADPGVTWRHLRESDLNLATALTLKFVLTGRGHSVRLTREADVYPSFAGRTRRQGADLFVAVHYNAANTYPMLYYASDPRTVGKPRLERNRRLALGIQAARPALGLRHVVPDTDPGFVRFDPPRLYISDYREGPSILWEVDRINSYLDTAEWRLARCTLFAEAVGAAWEQA